MSAQSPDADLASEVTSRDVLLAQRLVELADTLVDDYDVVDLLDTLVHAAVELLPVAESGLLLVGQDGALEVMASTSEAVRIIELLQLESAEGSPCIECVRSGAVVSVGDLTTEGQRWPGFAARAVTNGFHTVHAIPMRLRAEVIGGLNLFGEAGPTLSPADRRVAQALADVATIGILQQRSLHRVSLVAEQLQTALTTRVVIEQAKGVLAEFGKVEMEVAFAAMRGFARSSNRKLGEIAEGLVQRRLDPALVLAAGRPQRT